MDPEPAAVPDAPPHRTAPRELALSAAWHGGLTRSLLTADGRAVAVVFHGHWSNGFGPDFRDAMIEFPDRGLVTGSIEIHTRASDWVRHGHHLDDRYTDVILHVVARQDVDETRTVDGGIVPTVVLDVPTETLFEIDSRLPEIWATLGGAACAPELAAREPAVLRQAFWRLGDQRLDARSRRFEAELADDVPSAILARGIFDSFGFSENRAGMALVADAWNRHRPSVSAAGHAWTVSWLLGVAGYLPLAPADGHAAGLHGADLAIVESLWSGIESQLGEPAIAPTAWSRARTRPANHPLARLMSAAALFHATGHDPLDALLTAVRHRADTVTMIRELARSPYGPSPGQGRIIAMLADVVLPFTLAYARHTGDPELEDAASHIWAGLPMGEWSRPARRGMLQATGQRSMPRLGERGLHGLLHLDRTLCTPRRCYECPVAAEVIRDIQGSPGSTPVGTSHIDRFPEPE